jgi:hypothetical protein
MAEPKRIRSPANRGSHGAAQVSHHCVRFLLMNQLVLERDYDGHDVVSQRLSKTVLRFDLEDEEKTKAATQQPYVVIMQSLSFLYAVWG